MASSSSPPPFYSLEGRLLHAVASRNVENLKKIKEEIGNDEVFRHRCNTESDSAGLSVLHYAAQNGLIDMCTFLINVGVHVEPKTFKGDTPLLLAVKKNRTESAKYLIESGADIAITDCRGYTALHCAVKQENLEIMELLLTKGADIAAESVSGPPLHYAAKRGKIQSLKFLLGNKVEVDSVCRLNGFTPLVRAIMSRSVECVELLLNAGANPHHRVFTLSPLAHAITSHTNCINSLLGKGVDVNERTGWMGWTAVEHAAWSNNQNAVVTLFPLTTEIPSHECSIDYIMKNIHSENTEKYMNLVRCSRNTSLKMQCVVDLERKDYDRAVKCYSELIYQNPTDHFFRAMRSYCWTQLGESIFALDDAKACAKLSPISVSSHIRVGRAWNKIGRDHMAIEAFRRAIDLDVQHEA